MPFLLSPLEYFLLTKSSFLTKKEINLLFPQNQSLHFPLKIKQFHLFDQDRTLMLYSQKMYFKHSNFKNFSLKYQFPIYFHISSFLFSSVTSQSSTHWTTTYSLLHSPTYWFVSLIPNFVDFFSTIVKSNFFPGSLHFKNQINHKHFWISSSLGPFISFSSWISSLGLLFTSSLPLCYFQGCYTDFPSNSLIFD